VGGGAVVVVLVLVVRSHDDPDRECTVARTATTATTSSRAEPGVEWRAWRGVVWCGVVTRLILMMKMKMSRDDHFRERSRGLVVDGLEGLWGGEGCAGGGGGGRRGSCTASMQQMADGTDTHTHTHTHTHYGLVWCVSGAWRGRRWGGGGGGRGAGGVVVVGA
jgi:hypothetical protein